MITIICGDALEILKALPDETVQTCVTSPPYYRLRDYGVSGQIGRENTPAEYIEHLVSVFHEVRRVLKKDGTLWLNIADSYASSGKDIYRRKSKQVYTAMTKCWEGIKAKDMIGIPWALAFALRADGWYLRSDIIWHKPNCLPEPLKDRPTKSYEHIFLLSKSPQYYYDHEAIMEPLAESTAKKYQRRVSPDTKYAKCLPNQPNRQHIFEPRAYTNAPPMRNKRDVWCVSANTYRTNIHFAVFPEKLIEPCILAGSPIDGIVLDPFCGSGTTGAVSKRLGRSFIGIDLNSEYCRMAKSRIEAVKESMLSIQTGGVHVGSENQ